MLHVRRGGKTGRFLFLGPTSEGCGVERVGNKGGEGCGLEGEAESKPHGTANLIRHTPSGVVKCVGKEWSWHENL